MAAVHGSKTPSRATQRPGSAGILPAGLGKTRFAGRDAGAPRAGLPRPSPEGEGGFIGSLHFQFWTHLGTLTSGGSLVTGHWSLVIGDCESRRLATPLSKSPVTSDQ